MAGLKLGGLNCLMWMSYTSFESSWSADLEYIRFGSIP